MTSAHGATDHFAEMNGLRLHYLEWGDPASPAMVLLHGTASHSHVWEHFGPRFADTYHVIALDQRGHGDSDSPPDHTTGYPVSAWAQDLKAVVDGLGLAPVTLVGVSAGGNTAIRFAAGYPEATERLVVVEMGPEAARAGVARVIDSIPAAEEFDSLDAAIAYLTRAGGRSDPELGRLHAFHSVRPLGDGRYAMKGDPALRDRGWRRPLPTPAENWANVHAVTCPTLLVRGGDSKLLTAELAERMAHEMHDCTLVTIDGAGHAVPLHRPVEFEAAVRRWLSEQNESR